MEMLMLYLDLARKVGTAISWVLLGVVVWVVVATPVAVVLGRVAARADNDMPIVCEDDDEVTR